MADMRRRNVASALRNSAGLYMEEVCELSMKYNHRNSKETEFQDWFQSTETKVLVKVTCTKLYNYKSQKTYFV